MTPTREKALSMECLKIIVMKRKIDRNRIQISWLHFKTDICLIIGSIEIKLLGWDRWVRWKKLLWGCCCPTRHSAPSMPALIYFNCNFPLLPTLFNTERIQKKKTIIISNFDSVATALQLETDLKTQQPLIINETENLSGNFAGL